MPDSALSQVIELIEKEPQNGQSLLLYALVMSLSTANGHYLFLLNKLADMSPENRQLAYGLMELMVEGGNQTADWGEAVSRMSRAIRG